MRRGREEERERERGKEREKRECERERVSAQTSHKKRKKKVRQSCHYYYYQHFSIYDIIPIYKFNYYYAPQFFTRSFTTRVSFFMQGGNITHFLI